MNERCFVAVAARKGGVGKTVVACGLASALAHQGRRVLVIDLDPQSNAAYVLGVDPIAPGTAELLTGGAVSPLEATQELHVLPGGPELGSQRIQSLHPEELAEAVISLNYDVIVFDCPPGNEYLERLGVVAADVALVVTNAHPLAVIGAERVLEILESYQLKGRRGPGRWALVLSQIDARRSLDKQIAPQLALRYPQIPRFVIPQDTTLSLAAAEQVPLMDYDANCRGATELVALAQWVLDPDSFKGANNA
ncbi:MAG: ParA family protein [Symplocastrum torsivum CPER-KK1]|uniref:ParA family protein n=1 Tax=Symplocastrum torsivum CPER-KK1 TaxID=450513 RepID=A0A951UBQ8_9CYAN|nr:ParA family protein [Symplocastrum torsivum CPER-KK1]